MIDSIFIPVVIFLVIISFWVSALILLNVSDALSFIPFFQNLKAMQDALAYSLIAIYFGIPITSVALALASGSHPSLVFLVIPLIIISGILGVVLKETIANLIQSENSVLQWFNSYSFLPPLVQYFPFFMVVFSAIIIIAQFV